MNDELTFNDILPANDESRVKFIVSIYVPEYAEDWSQCGCIRILQYAASVAKHIEKTSELVMLDTHETCYVEYLEHFDIKSRKFSRARLINIAMFCANYLVDPESTTFITKSAKDSIALRTFRRNVVANCPDIRSMINILLHPILAEPPQRTHIYERPAKVKIGCFGITW